MKQALFFLLLVLPVTQVFAQTESAAFITRLGADTLAVEQFEYSDTGMKADVVLRTPSTQRFSYILERDREDGFVRMQTHQHGGSPTLVSDIVYRDDSLYVTGNQRGTVSTRSVSAAGDVLPFIDMVHWPFELVLRDAMKRGVEAAQQPLLSGSRIMEFGVGIVGEGRMTLTHPFRGTMEVEVDADGRLLMLNAGATTRKLIVTRTDFVDIDAFAARWTASDEAGKSFGPLSGRGSSEATVHGALLSVDFGQPGKRGREIFGSLVPYGELWRTGANQATHFVTDTNLTFGDLEVPVGTYTLFSIPDEGGGWLVVNKQTGQNGNSYDASQDLGRVPMFRTQISESVEWFTIAIEETEQGGLIRLQWDKTSYDVPFVLSQ